MKKNIPLIAATATLLAIAGVFVFTSHKAKKPVKPPTQDDLAFRDRSKADAIYHSPQAKKAYSDFIDRWKNNPDKKVQDQVGAARIRLAYLTAKDNDWKGARQLFKETASEYKGTGEMRADFGGIKDQALYQAAVTLNAEGKKAEYRAALVDFLKTQKLSPLVNAAYKRLVKVDGKATAEDDALLQQALDAQEKKIRFEMAVCGPKAIAYLLKLEGKGDFDYKVLAKDCGTNDEGTTMEGLRKGLLAHGLDYFGYRVGKEDLSTLPCPAILCRGEHYVVVTHAGPGELTIYDPSRLSEEKLPLDKIDDPQFNAIFLLKSAPRADGTP